MRARAVYACDKRWYRLLLITLSGVASGCITAFQVLPWLAWVSLTPAAYVLLHVLDDQYVRLRGFYGYGFLLLFSFYFVNYHWFVNLYPLDFAGLTPLAALAVVIVAWVGLPAFQASLGACFFVLFAILARSALCRRFRLLVPVYAAALWAVLEWSQTIGWWGVPWARLPIGQTSFLPFMQTASLLGSYFVTFLIVFVNFLLAMALYEVSLKRTLLIMAAAVFCANTVLGVVLYTVTDKQEQRAEETLKVAVIQGNISSQEKWTQESRQRTLDIYTAHTELAAEQGATLVIWPESTLPYFVSSDTVTGMQISALARRTHTTILVGALTRGDEIGEYNSMLAVLPDGSFSETVYSKRRLVPFGEFVPMRKLFEVLIPPLTELSMLSSDCLAGEDSEIFILEDVSVGSLICFDSIYESLALDATRDGAEILAVSTNDSWFLDSAALRMHLAQAQIRAVETGRPVARAANTGISAIIEANGQITSSLEPMVTGHLVEDMSVPSARSLYSRIGNSFIYLCLAGMALCILFSKVTSKKH